MTVTDDSQGGQPDEKTVQMKREDIRALEEAAKSGKEAEALRREVAMLKAGVSTDSPLGKMFFKSYEGQLDPEAIKAAAQEIGLLEVTTQTPTVSDDEKRATQERQAAANGAAGDSEPPKPHPRDEARQKSEEIINAGGTYEQAGAGYIETLVQRYAEGDQRAILDKSAPPSR